MAVAYFEWHFEYGADAGEAFPYPLPEAPAVLSLDTAELQPSPVPQPAAWVTLADGYSYTVAALVLQHSLRRVNTSYPLVVMHSADMNVTLRGMLQRRGAKIVRVDPVLPAKPTGLPKWDQAFTKLRAWGLPYRRLVWVDADNVLLQNADELFHVKSDAGATDWAGCGAQGETLASGVMVVQPSPSRLEILLQGVAEATHPINDQSLLQHAPGFDWRLLPEQYCNFVDQCTCASPLPLHQTKVVCYVSKPWLEEGEWDKPECETFFKVWRHMRTQALPPDLQ